MTTSQSTAADEARFQMERIRILARIDKSTTPETVAEVRNELLKTRALALNMYSRYSKANDLLASRAWYYLALEADRLIAAVRKLDRDTTDEGDSK